MASIQQNPPRSKGLHTVEPNFLEGPSNFSLVLAGPIFQFFRKSHLAGDGLELVHRRLIIFTLIAWLPLLLLAFLGKSAYAFGPILFAQGAMLAGLVAERVLYRGQSLVSFKLQIGGFVVFFVLAILGPLLMFPPQMARRKRKGLADYGLLAQRYVESFEQKWVRRPLASSEELLGTGDIQSLADLGNSYTMVRDMRAVPFGLEDISRLAAATVALLLPLLLTIFSPEELLMRVLKVVL